MKLRADSRSEHTAAQHRRQVQLLVAWLGGGENSSDVEKVSHE